MDEKLRTSLKGIEAPQPSRTAREAALEAAMAAFDAARQEETQKNPGSVQGSAFGARLRSIASRMKGNWTMDMRIPLGATFAALIVLPLGVAFLNQTALTPVGTGITLPPAERENVAADEAKTGGPAALLNRENADFAVAESAPMPAPMPSAAPMVSYEMAVGPQRGIAVPQPGDRFESFAEGGIQRVSENPVSTFSIDVDTTSYSYVRRMLETGQLPPPDAVRVEELVNYFDYDYGAPEGDVPFGASISVTPSPWNPENRLVHIGIEGQAVALEEVPPANLVLLIDTSGSMDEPDKLPLLKRAFALLVGEMGPDDTVAIVTYAGSAGVVLEPTPGSEKAKILAALEGLSPGGSTAGAEGIVMAYRLAGEALIEGGTNRVLLATDGDFNVGVSDPEALERLIAARRDEGIFLSVLGFGTGNYNDAAMQALAQAGNGTAAYIDSYSEARKVLVEELGGTLLTIARDVKVQVEFNPAAVSEYRLIGYETRALAREDFNNDAVDAGDVGAGHTVTAIYEVTPVGARGSVDPLRYGAEEGQAPAVEADELGFLKIRYKVPDAEASELIEMPIPLGGYADLAASPADVRFATAVAAFGQKLRGSDALRTMSWDEIRALAASGRGADETGRRAEFLRLVDIAAGLER